MLTANFSEKEMACSHCGECHMDAAFMDALQALRDSFGRPLIVTSGYRCPDHNDAISSTGRDGPHTTGRAVDLAVSRRDAHEVLRLAMAMTFTGIGVAQKGTGRFLHLDTLDGPTRPWVWSY
jgi:uncharacterized protein YcbK (DUF882 family)